MTTCVLHSRALAGVEAPAVRVEAHLANGLPSFTLVGLPETEVRESRDRVRAALQHCGFDFPSRRITVNLAPADLPKESGRFDLPIALAILHASGQLTGALDGYEFAGELGLTGELQAIRGALPVSLAASKAGRALILPAQSAAEAALVSHARVHAAPDLLSVCAYLMGKGELPLAHHQAPAPSAVTSSVDMADIRGQAAAKRALEVAAAGAHSLLMRGPPGTGKTLLAQALPGILPLLDEDDALETAAIQSLNGHFQTAAWRQRPWRSPHHSASAVALVGGGSFPRPGEISLAHHGVLFLDELPEFDRRVLEVLREPLESGHITISRAARQTDFPARFQLVAAMNPCPCGWQGHPAGKCRCTPDQIARYRGKLSGPLMDRIDLHVEVPSLPHDELLGGVRGEDSASVRARVGAARARQMCRQGKINARLTQTELDDHCALDTPSEQLLRQAMQKLDLSARSAHRILRVARSIADLADSPHLQLAHLAEAVQYRRHAL
jgi:magnesium chelatase family protein